MEWLMVPRTSRQLHADRTPLPDVPAIYFVSPTSENIKRIGEVG